MGWRGGDGLSVCARRENIPGDVGAGDQPVVEHGQASIAHEIGEAHCEGGSGEVKRREKPECKRAREKRLVRCSGRRCGCCDDGRCFVVMRCRCPITAIWEIFYPALEVPQLVPVVPAAPSHPLMSHADQSSCGNGRCGASGR